MKIEIVRETEKRIRRLRAAIGRETCPAREARMGAAIDRLKARVSGYWRDAADYRASELLLRKFA